MGVEWIAGTSVLDLEFSCCSSSHSFRCDVCLDQKSFHVHMQILHRYRTLLSTLRLFLNLSARVQKIIAPLYQHHYE